MEANSPVRLAERAVQRGGSNVQEHPEVEQLPMIVIRLHEMGIVMVVVALNALILPLAVFAWHEVVVGTSHKFGMSDREEKAKTYNFWSGLIVASLSKPIELMLTMLLGVVVLGVCSQHPVDVRSASFKHAYLLINGGILMMLTSGLSSLNVQHREVESNAQFLKDDLIGYAPVNGSTHKRIDGFARRSFSIDNSILRTAFDSPTQAGNDSDPCEPSITFEMPAVAFGFRPSPWMREMIPDGKDISPTRLALNVKDLLSKEVADDELQKRLFRVLGFGSSFLSKHDASAERLVFNLSTEFSFEALVADFPSTVNISSRNVQKQAHIPTQRCGQRVCITSIEEANSNFKVADISSQDTLGPYRKPFVWIPKDGLDINESGRSSLLVTSAGSRITASKTETTKADIPDAALSDGIKHFTLMVGRLSWNAVDLAKKFNASCAPGVDCTGITFSLQNNHSKVAVLGSKELKRLSEDVHLVNILSRDNFEVIFPQNVRDNKLKLRGEACSQNAAKYAKYVEVNHLYMEDPVQTSYMAALFYVFQYAALKERTVLENAVGPQVTLKLNGNDRIVQFYVVTPTKSAVLSIIGCMVMILTVAYTLYVNKNQQASEGQNLDHSTIVHVLLKSHNSAQHMLKCHFDHAEDFVTLASFEVDQVQLIHDTVGTVLLCGQDSLKDDQTKATGA